MKMAIRTIAICAAFLVMGIVTIEQASADSLVFDYHGWHVDLTKASGVAPDEALTGLVKHQLDITEHVGLKPDVLRFMKTVPIWADPMRRDSGPGHYQRATGVDVRVRALDRDKPIILHELLHAYHDQLLPAGFRNSEIEGFFERGKASWPADAYMVSNNREFFAVTASVYLFGDIPRPPFSRSLLREKQPDYFKWLADLFDNGKPRS